MMNLHVPPVALPKPPSPTTTNAGGTTSVVEGTITEREAHSDPYPCIKCPEHFASPLECAEHMSAAHAVEKPWICHECISAFADGQQRARHINNTHIINRRGGQIRCSSRSCKYEHGSYDLLGRHFKQDHDKKGSHIDKCPRCPYRNDSTVGVSVHFLHTHSPEAEKQRKKDDAERREAKRIETLNRKATAASATQPSTKRRRDDNEGATADATGSTPGMQEPAAKRVRAEPDFTNTDALLALQNANLKAIPNDTERALAKLGYNHKQSKSWRKPRKDGTYKPPPTTTPANKQTRSVATGFAPPPALSTTTASSMTMNPSTMAPSTMAPSTMAPSTTMTSSTMMAPAPNTMIDPALLAQTSSSTMAAFMAAASSTALPPSLPGNAALPPPPGPSPTSSAGDTPSGRAKKSKANPPATPQKPTTGSGAGGAVPQGRVAAPQLPSSVTNRTGATGNNMAPQGVPKTAEAIDLTGDDD